MNIKILLSIFNRLVKLGTMVAGIWKDRKLVESGRDEVNLDRLKEEAERKREADSISRNASRSRGGGWLRNNDYRD